MKYTIKRKERYQKGLEKGILTREEIEILKSYHEDEIKAKALEKELDRVKTIENNIIEMLKILHEYDEKAKNENEKYYTERIIGEMGLFQEYYHKKVKYLEEDLYTLWHFMKPIED